MSSSRSALEASLGAMLPASDRSQIEFAVARWCTMLGEATRPEDVPPAFLAAFLSSFAPSGADR